MRIHGSFSAILVFSAFASADADTSEATAYVERTQSPDGAWSSTTCGVHDFETTVLCTRALAEAGGPPETIDRALDWLADQGDSLDPGALALRALAFQAAGRDSSGDLGRLLDARIGANIWENQRSGWPASNGGSRGDIWTTALALEALGVHDDPPDLWVPLYRIRVGITAGRGILSPGIGGSGDLFTTALGVAALGRWRSRYNVFSVVTSQNIPADPNSDTISLARKAQESGVDSLVSAALLHMVLTSRVLLDPADALAKESLEARQEADGSWDGDPYTTAWALRALSVPFDSDADGISDEDEVLVGLDPDDPRDAYGDLDGDGLWNNVEVPLGTDPRRADTDGDGLSDAEEVRYRSDPLDPDDGNRPPAVASTPPRIAAAGQGFRYALQVDDPDGDATRCEVRFGPEEAVVNDACSLSWNVPAGTSGSVTVSVAVSDARGALTTHSFTIDVVPPGIDLAATSVDATKLSTDTQTLVATGAVQVELENRGATAFAGSFDVLVFSDANGSGGFEPVDDWEGGRVRFQGALAPGGSATVDVAVSARLAFRGAPLIALVDASDSVPETDETNNTASSTLQSRHAGDLSEMLPFVEWRHRDETYNRVLRSPVVASLDDDNGDGRIDERDVPELIYIGHTVNHGAGTLFALRGDTGEELWSWQPEGGVVSTKSPAVADLDADGVPEIIVLANDGGYFAINSDGTVKWRREIPSNRPGPTTIADLAGDGAPEIIADDVVYDSNGIELWRFPPPTGGPGQTAEVATALPIDLDLDGDLEVVTGARAHDHEGNILWYWSETRFRHHGLIVDGEEVEGFDSAIEHSALVFPAAIQADADPHPEIVLLSERSRDWDGHLNPIALWVIEHTGHLKWGPLALSFPDPERSSTPHTAFPAIADVDGDGLAEIVATLATFNHINLDPPEPEKTGVFVWHLEDLRRAADCGEGLCRPRWQREFRDGGSVGNPANPACFDFDGDGRYEIVTFSRHELLVLRVSPDHGGRLDVLWRVECDPDFRFLAPVVVDVDNDGGAEIVGTSVSLQQYGSQLRGGVFVVGDANDQWSNAQRIWNQHRFMGNHIGEDASVPASYEPHWLAHGTERANLGIPGHGPRHAPDLTVSYLRIDRSSCPAVRLLARVGNGGSIHAPRGVAVELWHGDPLSGGTLIGVALTETALYPGESEDVALLWEEPPAGGAEVYARVNPPPDRERIASDDLLPELLAIGPYAYARASAWTIHGSPWGFGFDGLIDDSRCWSISPAREIWDGVVFYDVHFALGVNVDEVTVVGSASFEDERWNTATLEVFTDLGDVPAYESEVTFTGVETTFDIPDITGVRRLNFAGNDVAGNNVYVCSLRITGSFETPDPVLNEGSRDNNTASAFVPFDCTAAVNRAPEIVSAPPTRACVGAVLEYSMVADDADALRYRLVDGPDGMAIDALSGVLTWTVEADELSAKVEVEVEARDDRGLASTQRFVLAVEACSNRPPVITSPAPIEASGLEWCHVSTADDPDGDALVWSLLEGPAGMEIDRASGELCWAPTPDPFARVTVRVEDGRGGADEQTFTLSPVDSTGPPPVEAIDGDDDGWLLGADCDDANPDVHPAATETPGNGIDDDCNPTTPDTLDAIVLEGTLRPSRLAVEVGETQRFVVRLTVDTTVTIAGQAELEVEGPLNGVLSSDHADIHLGATLAVLRTFEYETDEWPPGSYSARLSVRYGEVSVALAAAAFEVVARGELLRGTIAGPRRTAPGARAEYRLDVENVSGRFLTGVLLGVELLDPTGARELGRWTSLPVDLAAGATSAFVVPFDPAPAETYIALASAEVGGSVYGIAQTRTDVAEGPPASGQFRRGDSNSDGAVDISDPIHSLGFLFLGGSPPFCADAADSNDDGMVNISDASWSLSYLFAARGPPPPPPGPRACGEDATADELTDCVYPPDACIE